MTSNKSTHNIFSKEFNENPYPTYETIRETEPVYRFLLPDGQYAWMITKYEDSVEALKDLRFSKDMAGVMGISKDDVSIFTHNMLFADPPDHKRLRGLVQKAFTPRMIEGMRGRIQEITDELLDEASGKDHMNLIDEFAFPLPIIVICEILGIPKEDREKFRLWSNTMIEGSAGENSEYMALHTREFTQYLGEKFAKARKNPQQDLLSQLIISEEEGDKLTEKELYGVVSLLIIAGHETTVNLIGNSILSLLEHPEQLRLLKEQPNLIHTALEESLRYNGPVEFSTSRWAKEDFEFKGESIQKGQLVIIALNSANHDSNQFIDADVFNITREKSKHLAFGKGIHMCLGAPLARLEGEIAINSLLLRFPNLHLNGKTSDLDWRPGMVVRGVKELPLTLY